jgi:membrane fusion protein (multidrug efflux system)
VIWRLTKSREQIMEERGANQTHRRKKIVALIAFPAIIVIGAAAIYFYLQYKKTHISTDDAYVDGYIHTIAPKISGTVAALHIRDNQFVRAGDLLLDIEPQDYIVAVKQARAALETETAKLTQIRNTVETARKQLGQAIASLEAGRANLKLQEANLHYAHLQFERYDALFKKQVAPKQQYDQAKTAYEVALAQVKAAQDQVKQFEAAVETQEALIKETESSIPPQVALIRQREAALEAAELNRSYTRLYAPVDGYITNRTVNTGNQVQPAQPLLAVVPLSQTDIWITANYKETDLKRVRPGHKVSFTVDAYPGKVFHGRVNSIMAGTGAVFSLFPPENATGNFVKVVQRIPVKIALDSTTDPDHPLRIGMSVQPTIVVE